MRENNIPERVQEDIPGLFGTAPRERSSERQTPPDKEISKKTPPATGQEEEEKVCDYCGGGEGGCRYCGFGRGRGH